MSKEINMSMGKGCDCGSTQKTSGQCKPQAMPTGLFDKGGISLSEPGIHNENGYSNAPSNSDRIQKDNPLSGWEKLGLTSVRSNKL